MPGGVRSLRFFQAPCAAAAVTAGLALVACGHPASVQECDEIVDRIARLELKQRAALIAPGDIAVEVERTKRELRATTMKDCVGKRITERAMRCVREAESSKALVEDCFD
jgi:hypothetical protein